MNNEKAFKMSRHIITDKYTDEELSAKIAQLPTIIELANVQIFGWLTIGCFIEDTLNSCGNDRALKDRFVAALNSRLPDLGINGDFARQKLATLTPRAVREKIKFLKPLLEAKSTRPLPRLEADGADHTIA